MTATRTATTPHPIYLAGRWVESDDPLVIENPARPDEPAGSTFHATPAQYEEAVEAAVRAFEVTRKLPAYERGRILREVSAGLKAGARSWARRSRPRRASRSATPSSRSTGPRSPSGWAPRRRSG